MSVEWIDAARCRRAGVDPEWFNSPFAHQFSRKILRETQCIMRDEAAALSCS